MAKVIRELSFDIPVEGADVKGAFVELRKVLPDGGVAEDLFYSEQFEFNAENSTKNDDGSISATIPVAPNAKPDGIYNLYLYAVDDWGNRSDVPYVLEGIELDYVAPPTPVNVRLV